jgi:hypothetical protein
LYNLTYNCTILMMWHVNMNLFFNAKSYHL